MERGSPDASLERVSPSSPSAPSASSSKPGPVPAAKNLVNRVDLTRVALQEVLETLLRMPFITMHEGQQERLMRAWLEKLGQPDGKEEAPIFMQWDCNPLLPPPTPQGARRSRSPTPSSHAVCGPDGQADQVLDSRDLDRCPLQFLLDSNQVRLDGDRAAAALPPQKRAKTQDSVASGLP